MRVAKKYTAQKDFGLKILKTTDGDETIIIEGLANAFTIDRVKEIIDPNGIDLTNYKKNPVIMVNHGMDPSFGALPVGKAIEIKPTKDGLYIKAQLSNSKTEKITMIRDLVKERILRAFSIGFDPREQLPQEGDIIKTSKSELIETSMVGVPMNADSIFQLGSKCYTSEMKGLIMSKICTVKGALVAAMVNEKIEEEKREEIIAAIAEKTELEIDYIKDVLAGNVTPVPEPCLMAIASILDLSIDDLKEKNEMDVNEDKKQASTTAQSLVFSKEVFKDKEECIKWASEHDYKSDNVDETEDSFRLRQRDPEEFEEDSFRTIELDKGISLIIGKIKEENKENDKNDKERKSFQECVSEKIPKLIDEGKTQDQAVAMAIAYCREEGKCTFAPKREEYATYFKIADEYSTAKKQADQENVKSPDTSIPEKQADTIPLAEYAKQTNVLLGQLIAEVQTLSAKIISTEIEKVEDEIKEDDEKKEEEGLKSDQKMAEEAETSKRLDTIKKKLDYLNSRAKNLFEKI